LKKFVRNERKDIRSDLLVDCTIIEFKVYSKKEIIGEDNVLLEEL